MKIEKVQNGTEMTVVLEGRLDAIGGKELQEALINNIPDDVKTLILDMEKLNYLVSAGMRVLMSLRVIMKNKGKTITIAKPNDEVWNVFEITGMDDYFIMKQ